LVAKRAAIDSLAIVLTLNSSYKLLRGSDCIRIAELGGESMNQAPKQLKALAILAGIILGILLMPRDSRADSYYFCDQFPYLCTDPVHYPGTAYVGHDEPALIFYSATPGAGNSFKGLLTLPKDPSTKPNQSGTGGTWNFQLHPAFWFGMAMCDTQSFPEFTTTCTPDSDTNIFDNADSSAADFIGKHPGTAFMEMQFYPPGWVIAPNSTPCSATK
jgi:hypothetical protein